MVPVSHPHHARSASTIVLRCVAALLVVAAGTVVAAGVDAPPADAAGCGPAPQGQVAVVMVIDRGTGSPSTRCAVVPQGSTGLDALRAAGHDVRLDGGFVCGIDGLPATGCGNRPDAGFAYWRYWHAAPGGAWSYSQVGAGGYRLPARCAVEGWVWSDSPSSNTPPSVPAPTPTCEAPPTTAAPTLPPRPAPTVPAPVAPTGGGAVPTSPPTTAAPGSGGAPATVSGAPPASVAGETTVPPDPALADVPSPEGAGAGEGEPSSSTDPDRGDGRPSAGGADADAETEGELAASAEGPSSSGAPWGVAVAVVLVAALGGAAAWRSRRRSVDTPV
jgi:hypothetical protein